MTLALLGGLMIGLSDSCQLDGGLTCPPFSKFVQGKAFLGNILALAGAWAVAGYLMIGRRLRAAMALIPYIFVVYGSAAICLLVAMILAGQSPGGFSPWIYVWILLLALVPQLIGHTTYNWALRYLPAALVSITTLAEPVGSAILAFVILQEAPTRLIVFGGVLILAGIYLASRTRQTG
jgi:drug/metabolite transporter (DMT)-like permease